MITSARNDAVQVTAPHLGSTLPARNLTLERTAPPVHTECCRVFRGRYSGAEMIPGAICVCSCSCTSFSRRADKPGTGLPPPQISKFSNSTCMAPPLHHYYTIGQFLSIFLSTRIGHLAPIEVHDSMLTVLTAIPDKIALYQDFKQFKHHKCIELYAKLIDEILSPAEFKPNKSGTAEKLAGSRYVTKHVQQNCNSAPQIETPSLGQTPQILPSLQA